MLPGTIGFGCGFGVVVAATAATPSPGRHALDEVVDQSGDVR